MRSLAHHYMRSWQLDFKISTLEMWHCRVVEGWSACNFFLKNWFGVYFVTLREYSFVFSMRWKSQNNMSFFKFYCPGFKFLIWTTKFVIYNVFWSWMFPTMVNWILITAIIAVTISVWYLTTSLFAWTFIIKILPRVCL